MRIYPATHRVLVRHLLHQATTRGDRLAVLDATGDPPRRRTWRQLVAHVADTATRLRDAGATAGDTVGVACCSSLEWIVGVCAIHWLGMVDVPIEPSRGDEAAIRCFERAGCRCVLASGTDAGDALRSTFSVVTPACHLSSDCPADDQLRAADQRLRGIDPQSTSTILFTSGTTSEPKGVVLTHANLSSNAAGKLHAVPQAEDEVRVNVLPLAHAYGRTCDFGTWLLSGGTLAICPAASLLDRMPRIRPHLINAVPLIIDRILGAAEASSWQAATGGRLRAVGCGGAALGDRRFDQLRALGISVIHGYGTTETSPVICSTRTGDERRGTVGPPIEGVQVRIEADGQLACRGPNVCAGYLGDATELQRCTTAGWWRTSDLAAIDEHGHVTIFGRADDVLVLSSGRKIQPAAIEARLAASPGIRHVMLTTAGGKLTAMVDAEDPSQVDPGLLLAGFAARLADLPRWQVPRQAVVFPRHLTVVDGDLNHKGALRRAAIRQNFASLVRDA